MSSTKKATERNQSVSDAISEIENKIFELQESIKSNDRGIKLDIPFEYFVYKATIAISALSSMRNALK